MLRDQLPDELHFCGGKPSACCGEYRETHWPSSVLLALAGQKTDVSNFGQTKSCRATETSREQRRTIAHRLRGALRHDPMIVTHRQVHRVTQHEIVRLMQKATVRIGARDLSVTLGLLADCGKTLMKNNRTSIEHLIVVRRHACDLAEIDVPQESWVADRCLGCLSHVRQGDQEAVVRGGLCEP